MQGFDHTKVALSIGVQAMVRAELGGSGTMFSIDTESGFPGVVVVSAAWGLGEPIVRGAVDPDRHLSRDAGGLASQPPAVAVTRASTSSSRTSGSSSRTSGGRATATRPGLSPPPEFWPDARMRVPTYVACG